MANSPTAVGCPAFICFLWASSFYILTPCGGDAASEARVWGVVVVFGMEQSEVGEKGGPSASKRGPSWKCDTQVLSVG